MVMSTFFSIVSLSKNFSYSLLFFLSGTRYPEFITFVGP